MVLVMWGGLDMWRGLCKGEAVDLSWHAQSPWAVGRVRGWTGWWRRKEDASAVLGRRAERRARRQAVGQARGGEACRHEAGHGESAALGHSFT